MIATIDESLCINCGLCEHLCQMDVLQRRDNKIVIAYRDDCCNCMECVFVCPTDAILLDKKVPEKFDARLRWKQVKEALCAK